MPSNHEYGFDWVVFADAADENSGRSTAYFYDFYEDCYREMQAFIRKEAGKAWMIRRTPLTSIGKPVPSNMSVILAQSKICPVRSMQEWRDKALI